MVFCCPIPMLSSPGGCLPVSAHLVPDSFLETSLTGAILPDHSSGLGENQLRPSARSLMAALAAQRVTRGVRSSRDNLLALTDQVSPPPCYRWGSFTSWRMWIMTVFSDLTFSVISFHWLFEILMVVWWMKLTDGWCENNFNKQSQWCHNGKLIQTPDKCPSRPRPLVMVGCESLKICPSVLWMWPMEPPVRVTFVQSISPHWAQHRGGGCL